MANPRPGQAQKGSGSKSIKNPGAASRKAKRVRYKARIGKRKDLRVLKSSHGVFTSVAQLEAHRNTPKHRRVTPSLKPS